MAAVLGGEESAAFDGIKALQIMCYGVVVRYQGVLQFRNHIHSLFDNSRAKAATEAAKTGESIPPESEAASASEERESESEAASAGESIPPESESASASEERESASASDDLATSEGRVWPRMDPLPESLERDFASLYRRVSLACHPDRNRSPDSSRYFRLLTHSRDRRDSCTIVAVANALGIDDKVRDLLENTELGTHATTCCMRINRECDEMLRPYLSAMQT